MSELVPALSVGFVFGFLLQKTGLSRYDRIANVYRLRDLAVVKFLLSALVVGAVCLRGLEALGLSRSLPVPSTFWVGNLAGGTIFGAGMALSGFCPGTIAAGIGEGRLDYLVPGALGLVAGALGYGAVYAWVAPLVGRGAIAGATIPALLHVDPWLVVAALALTAAIVFWLVERPSDGSKKAGAP